MPSKVKIPGYKRELFVVDNELAAEFATMIKDKKQAQDFARFHEPKASGWPDDPIIRSYKREFESARTIREETYDPKTEKAAIKKTA